MISKLVTPALQHKLLQLTEETGRKLVMTVKQGKLYLFVDHGKSKVKPSIFRSSESIDEQELIQHYSIIKSLVWIACYQSLVGRLVNVLHG